MPVPTPATLRRALATHRGADDAFRALSVTRQAIYRKADGAHVHPELVAILREHVATTRDQRNARGELGKHSVALPSEVAAKLRAHKRHLSRVVRATITAALRGPLPVPLPAGRGMVVTLDLGATWGALGAAAGTDDPQQIAGILRGILASADVPAPSPPLGRADRRPTMFTPALAERGEKSKRCAMFRASTKKIDGRA